MRTLFDSREKILQNALQIRENIVVPIADNHDALFRKPACPSFIGTDPPFGVLSAVNFNRKPEAHAIKVERIRPDRMLSSELMTIELAPTQRTPGGG